MKKYLSILFSILTFLTSSAQINTDRVMMIGRNALYFEDYVLAIQYFNQIIKTKPYLADSYYYRAVAKYFLDDFKGAEDDCTLSIERNPFIYGAYQLRADSRQNQKNYLGAEEDYQMALKQSPKDKFILINLGIVNIENKQYNKAEQYLNELTSNYPTFTEGILIKANLFLEKNDTLNAIKQIDLAVKNDTFFAPGYSMRASVKLALKQYDEAIHDYNKSIELDPLNVANYINRGLAKYYKNDLRGAMSDYDYVIKTESSNLIAYFNRALLRAQVGDDNRAIEDFNFVLKNDPDNYIAYMNRALLNKNIGDYKSALKDLNVVLTQYPNFYQGYKFRSDIKRKLNDLRGAEQDYDTALRIEKKIKQDILSGRTLQGIDQNTKTREESDKTIHKFNLLVVADKQDQQKNKYNSETRGKVQNKQANVDLMPSFTVTYYEDESALNKFINYNKEVEVLNKQIDSSKRLLMTNSEAELDSTQIEQHFRSIDLNSNLIANQSADPILYFTRGVDYMLIKDYNSAVDDFNRSLSINPNFVLAYFNLASSYEKLLKMKISNPNLYNNVSDLGAQNQLLNNTNKGIAITSTSLIDENTKILMSKLEYDQIINNYNKIIQLSPDFIYAYYNRANLKAMQGDLRGAILDYNEAICIDNDFSDAYYNRGICRLRLKDMQRGMEDLRKAGELGIISAYSIIKRLSE